MVTVKNLSFTYNGGEKPALSQISLDILPGELVLLCGTSGCGKTTLLRLLKQELAPYGTQTGEITVAVPGEAVGFVMQNPDTQIVTDKVWHELAFGLENLGIPGDTIARRIGETAAYFGIDAWLEQDTATLSGGQKQILNLAACMVCQPRLLLLDEPTAMLDPVAADQFLTLVQRLNRELGVTVVIVEHRLEAVLPMADRTVVLDQGLIVPDALPEKAMPAAWQIHRMLSGEGPAPLTVRDGKMFLQRHFDGFSGSLAIPEPPVKTGKPLLMGKHLAFRYDRQAPDLLQDISLEIDPGDFYCIVGGNGVGKSTFLKVLAGVCKPYRGNVTASGKVAMLPQNPRLVFLYDTVLRDYVAVADETRALAVAQSLGIAHLLDRHPFDLSGGEQQKAALGKLLLVEPQVLLLDEPTKGLDVAARDELAAFLRTLCGQGTAVVVVTHDLDFCSENATCCALLSGGHLLGADEPHRFFSGNRFYTTAAKRIGEDFCTNAITPREVADCLIAGKEHRS